MNVKPATAPNRPNWTVAEVLDSIGCRPLETLAQIASGDLACGICQGTGRTKFQSPGGKVRRCKNCRGSGKEIISPELQRFAREELKKYGIEV